MRTLANLAAIVVLAHLTGCCCGFPLIQSPTSSLRDLEVPAPTFADADTDGQAGDATLPSR